MLTFFDQGCYFHGYTFAQHKHCDSVGSSPRASHPTPRREANRCSSSTSTSTSTFVSTSTSTVSQGTVTSSAAAVSVTTTAGLVEPFDMDAYSDVALISDCSQHYDNIQHRLCRCSQETSHVRVCPCCFARLRELRYLFRLSVHWLDHPLYNSPGDYHCLLDDNRQSEHDCTGNSSE